jgi:hypothetical protein
MQQMPLSVSLAAEIHSWGVAISMLFALAVLSRTRHLKLMPSPLQQYYDA